MVAPIQTQFGWHLHAHAIFLGQIERLSASVRQAFQTGRPRWQNGADARLLMATRAMMLDRIPTNPLRRDYRPVPFFPGWHYARFGNGRFRLFFRVVPGARAIIYAWIADRDGGAPIAISAEPHVLFGAISSVNARGLAVMPLAARAALDLQQGGTLDLRAEGDTLIGQVAPAQDAALTRHLRPPAPAPAIPRAPDRAAEPYPLQPA